VPPALIYFSEPPGPKKRSSQRSSFRSDLPKASGSIGGASSTCSTPPPGPTVTEAHGMRAEGVFVLVCADAGLKIIGRQPVWASTNVDVAGPRPLPRQGRGHPPWGAGKRQFPPVANSH